MFSRKKGLIIIAVALMMVTGAGLWSAISVAAPPPPPPTGPTLDPLTITKYVNQLVVPPAYVPNVVADPASPTGVRHDYTISVNEFMQQILPAPLPQTKVWGYGGNTTAGPLWHSPAATIVASRNTPVRVTWENNITTPYFLPVDPTLMWADPNNMGMPMPPFPAFPPGFPQAQSTVPIVTHLHGGEVRSDSDGHLEGWWTNGLAKTGPTFTDNVFDYPNQSPPTTLWYHDHTLGLTRLNTMSGLAGFYLLTDPADPNAAQLPSGPYDLGLALQDRDFNADGSFFYPSNGINPTVHPYWMPEYFGQVSMVNGRTWPNLNVDPRQYSLRLLDGSTARFYNVSLVEAGCLAANGPGGCPKIPFTQVGAEGGYLPAPAPMTQVLLGPGERSQIVVDFSGLAPGTKIVMVNDARAPYPNGAKPDHRTIGQLMQFTVSAAPATAPTPIPATLNTIPALTPTAPERILTLNEVMGAGGPLEVLQNGQKYSAPITEQPQVGSTEDWAITNMTADTHPIHLHLQMFQVVSRQKFDVKKYTRDWIALNGQPPLNHPTIPLDYRPYLKGAPIPAAANETGWKDTVKTNPGEVTILRVRFAPTEKASATPGVNQYPFDPGFGPGYVWHCHIIDHEDNEMMRPMVVTP